MPPPTVRGVWQSGTRPFKLTDSPEQSNRRACSHPQGALEKGSDVQ